jgi:hypothetical protein
MEKATTLFSFTIIDDWVESSNSTQPTPSKGWGALQLVKWLQNSGPLDLNYTEVKTAADAAANAFDSFATFKELSETDRKHYESFARQDPKKVIINPSYSDAEKTKALFESVSTSVCDKFIRFRIQEKEIEEIANEWKNSDEEILSEDFVMVNVEKEPEPPQFIPTLVQGIKELDAIAKRSARTDDISDEEDADNTKTTSAPSNKSLEPAHKSLISDVLQTVATRLFLFAKDLFSALAKTNQPMNRLTTTPSTENLFIPLLVKSSEASSPQSLAYTHYCLSAMIAFLEDYHAVMNELSSPRSTVKISSDKYPEEFLKRLKKKAEKRYPDASSSSKTDQQQLNKALDWLKKTSAVLDIHLSDNTAPFIAQSIDALLNPALLSAGLEYVLELKGEEHSPCGSSSETKKMTIALLRLGDPRKKNLLNEKLILDLTTYLNIKVHSVINGINTHLSNPEQLAAKIESASKHLFKEGEGSPQFNFRAESLHNPQERMNKLAKKMKADIQEHFKGRSAAITHLQDSLNIFTQTLTKNLYDLSQQPQILNLFVHHYLIETMARADLKTVKNL